MTNVNVLILIPFFMAQPIWGECTRPKPVVIPVFHITGKAAVYLVHRD